MRFGRLAVTGEAPSVMSGGRVRRIMICVCDCGSIDVKVRLENLRRGTTWSCGCGRRDTTAAFNRRTKYRHGLKSHYLYNTWNLIIQRCENPQWRHFSDYGGRGIGVYGPWHDLVVFIADIERLLGPRPSGYTLNRIDNDGNYEPGNVEWADSVTQARNQRPRRTVKGLRLPKPDMLALAGVMPSAEAEAAAVELLRRSPDR